jgi:hypothetical protein
MAYPRPPESQSFAGGVVVGEVAAADFVIPDIILDMLSGPTGT